MREDWIECKAEDFGELIRGITYNKNQASDIPTDNYLPLLRANNINDNKLNFDDIKYVEESLIDDFQKIIPNDILIAMSSGSKHLVGKSAQSKGHYEGSFGAFCAVFRPNQNLSGNYVSYFFQSNDFRKNISEISKGSNINNLKREHILDFVFPIAPLPIQRAIVSKIEALFSDLDNGIANFKKAQEQLKIYRQAVLKKAFEGELTKEWRAKQTHLPTAEELLKQIKEERQNHYNQQIEDWKKAVKEWEKGDKKGKRPSRISKPKELPNVKESDVETYENLPLTWQWSKFGNVTYKIGDIDHKMPKTVSNGYPYLSTGDLNKDGTIDFSGAKTISKEDFDRLALKIKPEKGDIIFPRYGTIGRNILIDFDKEFLVSYACAIIKNIRGLMSSKFALYYSLSPVIKKEIRRYTVETTQANIGIASIENFVFPLCSTEEQNQIVQEIESRLSVCDKVEESITESIIKAEALRQSILKKAFEGKLLSQAEIELCKQAADYEPASELLKKIQAEKLAKEQEKKKKPTFKKKSKK